MVNEFHFLLNGLEKQLNFHAFQELEMLYSVTMVVFLLELALEMVFWIYVPSPLSGGTNKKKGAFAPYFNLFIDILLYI